MRIPSELPGRPVPNQAPGSTRRLKPPGQRVLVVDERDSPDNDSTITTGKHQSSVFAKLPEAGEFVRQYQLIRELGRGGMSTVFLARDTQLGRLVALKFLTYRSTEANNRMLDEARATARCQHENIIIIHEFGEHDGCTFIALEYLKGQTLQALMLKQPLLDPDAHDKARTPMPARRAVEIMVSVVRALVQAHAMGILHRDLKPANILLTEMGTIKVLDFGIAKAFSRLDRSRDDLMDSAELPSTLSHTLTGAMVGTLPYMAPEQVNLDEIDHRCDIWACGIILYEMVAGRHPLAPLNAERLKQAAQNLDEPMPSLAELMPELGTLAGIIDRCLIKNKDDRTATAAALLAELEALGPRSRLQTLTVDERPFAGLEAFQEANADRFFGRGQEVAAAVTRLRSHPLLAVVGPSGAGKSSLIRAGIMPALKRSGEGWDALSLRPGRNPLAALAAMLEHAHSSLSLSSGTGSDQSAFQSGVGESYVDRDALIERLRNEPGFLAARLRNRASKKLRRTVIFIDQFEELYTLTPSGPERDACIRCIAAAADDISSPLRVILSIRSDFLHQMAEDRAFAALVTQGLLFMPPLGREALREALVRPIEAADYCFESDTMVASMLDELEGTRVALPILQFTAAKLWDMRDRERRVLTRSSYEQIGGVAGALTSHADAVLVAMSSSDQALARIVLEHLVTPEHTRAMASMSELCARGRDAAGIERVIDHLAQARLLVVETGLEGDEGATVELIHESLIESWPTLRHWLSEHREDAAFLGRLRTAAKQWHTSGRTEGLLWRGEPAREAERWRMRYRGELSRLEREYLDATISLENRAARRKRALIAGSMAFLVLLILAGSVALFSIRRAEKEAKQQAAIVKQQLAELQNKEAALRSKEQESRLAAERANTATQDAEMSKEQLRDALVKERASKKEAERARDEARQAERSAQQALERAERAAQAEREAKEDLQRFIGLGPKSTARGIRFNYKPRNKPREIYLAGTFNGWNPNNDFMLRDEDGDGIYSITVPLGRGSYFYKFFVDGVWIKDPNAPMTEPDGFGGLNGVFEVK